MATKGNPLKLRLLASLLFVVGLQAQPVTFTTNSNGLATVIFQGTNYNYIYGEHLLTAVFELVGGVKTQFYAPPCTGSFTSTTITQTCTANGDTFHVVVTFSNSTPNTINAQISFQNTSSTNTVIEADFSTLGLQLPQYDGSVPPVTLSESNPLTLGSFVTGRFAIWNNAPSSSISVNYGGCPTCKFQPGLLGVAPGVTANASFSMRLTTNLTGLPVDVAPEAYAAYATSYPSIINWPDRRPINLWFDSDNGHRSALNPRGYLNDPTLDVSNIPNFVTKITAAAQTIINTILARPVQPQGVIIWDVEGQEFAQSTSYIGDPRVLSQGYAPEMNAAADQLFTMFKNAGFKVGITLRPNYMMWGLDANLPPTCHTDANNAYRDYYISVDAAFGQKFHNCYLTDTWGINPNGNGSQTVYLQTQVQQVIDLLVSKVAYARARWGTTLYYVDSTVWVGGTPISASIFRALQAAYPDSLFMPEQSYIGDLASTLPYAATNGSLNALYAPPAWRYAYPNGAEANNLSNCSGTCFTNDEPSFFIGQVIGDIALYNIPGQLSAPGLAAIENMITTARASAGTVIVTDSGTNVVRNYSGDTLTGFPYPMKMRVYFADSNTDLPASALYCENGQWGGQNFCTLNLGGMKVSQVRFYDFAGNLTSSNASQNLSSGGTTGGTQTFGNSVLSGSVTK